MKLFLKFALLLTTFVLIGEKHVLSNHISHTHTHNVIYMYTNNDKTNIRKITSDTIYLFWDRFSFWKLIVEFLVLTSNLKHLANIVGVLII